MAENYYYSSLTGAELDAALKQVSQAADYAGAAEAAAAQAAQTAAGLDSHCAPPIVAAAQGESIAVTDSAARPMQGLTLFGKTVQDGTPTPETPVELENVGSGGSIGVTVNAQILTVSAPSGLPGIPVGSGGNYTDADGQRWICDEIDFSRGVYVQRVGRHIVTANDVGTQIQDGCVQITNPADFLYQYGTPMLCNRFVNNPEAYCDGVVTATLYLGDGEFSNRYWAGSTSRFLYFKSSLFTDLSAVKAWFAANETVVLYPLAEPVETPIPDGEMAAYHALRTQYSTTTVINDRGAHMELRYVADTQTYIDRKINALSAAMLNT